MPILLVMMLKMYNMDERPLVYIFVFTYLHRRISFDVLHSQNVFKYTFLKVDFSTVHPLFFLFFLFLILHHFLSTHIHLYTN